jgi:hypothetical protein
MTDSMERIGGGSQESSLSYFATFLRSYTHLHRTVAPIRKAIDFDALFFDCETNNSRQRLITKMLRS